MRPGVGRRIDRVLKALERLDKLAGLSVEELHGRDLLPVLEREVEVVIQGLLDIGGYIISVMGWSPPSTYGEIGPILATQNVLDREKGEILKALAGLRNLVVHAYADIDYELLLEHARRLRRDARSILMEMVNYVRSRGVDP